MTISVFIIVPIARKGGAYIIEGENATYQHSMGVLLLLNLIIFVNENTKIFKKKVLTVSLSGAKRLITVAIALVLWAVVCAVTILNGGKELVWLMWIVTSLCISGY